MDGEQHRSTTVGGVGGQEHQSTMGSERACHVPSPSAGDRFEGGDALLASGEMWKGGGARESSLLASMAGWLLGVVHPMHDREEAVEVGNGDGREATQLRTQARAELG
jgi:hypothetical protein